MPRPRSPAPRLRRHGDRAVCDYYDPGTGRRRMATLGGWGTAAAAAAYDRLLADLAAARVAPPPGDGLTVAELCVRYLAHARDYYRGADGRPTSELASFRGALAALDDVAGELPAAEFGPRALAAVLDAMVARGWTRGTANKQLARVRQVWRWAAAAELVPAEKWLALKAVRGLARGRTAAPEPEPVRPAPLRAVVAALRVMPPPVAAICRLLWLTGCRPQDACRLRAEHLDRSGEVWVYRPPAHKGAWRGKAREVYVGPKAQRLLSPWLEAAGGGPAFPTPRGRAYRTDSLDRAVSRACAAAGVTPWTPMQLRHSAGTRFRELFGLETARVLLGHDRTSTTEIYAEKPRRAAAEAMRRAG